MRKMLILLVAAIMLLPCAAQAADTPYYDDSLVLSTLPATQTQRELADVLYAPIANCDAAIRLPANTKYEDLKIAMRIIFHDYPELFHYSGQYLSYRSNSDSTVCTKIEPVYNYSRSEYTAMSAKMWKQIDAILDQSNTIVDAHDYVVDHVTYQKKEAVDQTAYGALINGAAQCAGYTDAITLLFRRAGIPCGLVSGTATHDDGSTIDHTWNIVDLGGVSYIDATWNDLEPYANTHWYYCIDAKLMHRNHTPEYPDQVPAGVSGRDWHTKNGLYVTDQKSLYAALEQLAENNEVSLRLNDEMYKLLREKKTAQFQAYNKQAKNGKKIPMNVTFASLYSDVQKTLFFFEYK